MLLSDGEAAWPPREVENRRRVEDKEKRLFTGIFRINRMTAKENALRGTEGVSAVLWATPSGSGWYRAFRSELLAAQHPPDPATLSLAERQGGEELGKKCRRGEW